MHRSMTKEISSEDHPTLVDSMSVVGGGGGEETLVFVIWVVVELDRVDVEMIEKLND